MSDFMIASYLALHPRQPGTMWADLFAASGTFRKTSRQWPQPRAMMATFDS
jgi:hypothetical protein